VVNKMSTDNMANQPDNLEQQQQQIQQSIPKHSSRVFMLEQSQNVDVVPAFQYGPIIPLFKSTTIDRNNKSEKKIDRPSMWHTEEFADEIIKKLEEHNYNPETDYLLVAGHVVPLIIFTCTVVSQWENVQVLFWSSGFQKYVVRRL